MKLSESVKAIGPALLRAQKNMGSAIKTAKNLHFKTKYADVGAVIEVVKEPLNKEGIIVLQPVTTINGEHFVETVLLHESGEMVMSEPFKLIVNKQDMQGLGSAITYARRYTLQSLLGIPSEDDDGEASVERTPEPPQQKPTQGSSPKGFAAARTPAPSSSSNSNGLF